MPSAVQFHFVDLGPFPLYEDRLSEWLMTVAKSESYVLSRLSIHLCSDEYLLQMNRTHLNHDYYTDIITFDSSKGSVLKGELFISWDRVQDNALKEGVDSEHELHRVMAHGLLHLMGYGDKTEEESREMREKEDWALDLR